MAAPIEQEQMHFERAWGEAARWKSALMLIHPIGVLLYVLITFCCAVIAAHGVPPARQLAPLLLAMFFSQSVVGIANEVADREIDARAKPWRPLAAGYITPQAAVWLGLAGSLLALLSAGALSLPAAALLFCGMATGVIYDVWLKRTPLSWLPYVVTYPGFPLWVWLALGLLGGAPGGLLPSGGAAPATLSAWAAAALASPWLPRLLAVYPVMIPLALAAHLCNQLRDYEADLALGVRGLVHYLGQPQALRLCFALLLLGPLPMLCFPLPPRPQQLLSVGLAAAWHWVVVGRGIRAYLARREPNSMRRLFRLLQLTGPLLSLVWLVNVLG